MLVPRQVALHGQYERLITSAFLHVSIWHIAFNMIALYLVGPYLERLLGPWRFAALYLLSALGGSVAVYLFDSKYIAVVGASGAIFGLFAACLMFVRELGLDPRWLIGTIVINFVLTFSVADISKLGPPRRVRHRRGGLVRDRRGALAAAPTAAVGDSALRAGRASPWS